MDKGRVEGRWCAYDTSCTVPACRIACLSLTVSASLHLTHILAGVDTHPVYACRDDCGRLALHWSAELGLAEVCQLLLQATTEAAAALTAQVAAASAADAAAGEEPPLDPPNLLEMQVGTAGWVCACMPLHVCAVAAWVVRTALLYMPNTQAGLEPHSASDTGCI